MKPYSGAFLATAPCGGAIWLGRDFPDALRWHHKGYTISAVSRDEGLEKISSPCPKHGTDFFGCQREVLAAAGPEQGRHDG